MFSYFYIYTVVVSMTNGSELSLPLVLGVLFTIRFHHMGTALSYSCAKTGH